MSANRVSVIVPTYQRKRMLPAVLRPLLSDPATLEAIVVVDGCDDGSSELLAEWALRDPKLRWIFQENAGSAAARQRGIVDARGDVILMLDDDVVANEGLVSGHAKWHEEGAKLVVVGYMPIDISLVAKSERVPAGIYSEEYESTCRSYGTDPDEILRHLWSGNVSLRRLDTLTVGVTSRLGIGYHEDMEFGLRCLTAGLTGVFDPNLRATHHFSRSVGQVVRDSRSSGYGRGRILRDAPDVAATALHPLSGFSRWGRLVIETMSSAMLQGLARLLLGGMCAVTGLLHLERAEKRLLQYLIYIELNAGYVESGGPTLAEIEERARLTGCGDASAI